MKNCVHCGAELPSPNRYCGSCGSPVTPTNEVAPLDIEETITARKPWRLLEILFLVGCIGTAAGIFLPVAAYVTSPSSATIDHQMTSRGIFYFGISMYLLGRWRRWRRPWIHALAGSMLLFLSATIAVGIEKNRQEEARNIPINKFLASLKKLDSQAADKLNTGSVSKENTRPIIRSALRKAIHQAPDEAVLRFNDSRLRALSSGENNSACSTAAYQELPIIINDGWQEAPKFDSQRPLLKTTAAQDQIMFEAMATLFDAAAQNASKVAADDLQHVDQLLKDLKIKADPRDVYSSTAVLEKLSATEMCDLYQTFMTAIHTLPPDHAALILRYLTTFD